MRSGSLVKGSWVGSQVAVCNLVLRAPCCLCACGCPEIPLRYFCPDLHTTTVHTQFHLFFFFSLPHPSCSIPTYFYFYFFVIFCPSPPSVFPLPFLGRHPGSFLRVLPALPNTVAFLATPDLHVSCDDLRASTNSLFPTHQRASRQATGGANTAFSSW